MYNSKISSNLLYHFTSSIDILISILENGFRPMTAIEDISFILPNYEEAKVGIPIVCFTDIPIELADEHRKEYGLFGLGTKKEWGIKNGLNPITIWLVTCLCSLTSHSNYSTYISHSNVLSRTLLHHDI